LQTSWAVNFQRDGPARCPSTKYQVRVTSRVIGMKVRHERYSEISGFDCRKFSFEGCGFSAAHNTWSEIDEVSAIINDDCGSRTGTVGIGNRRTGAEEHHLRPCCECLNGRALWRSFLRMDSVAEPQHRTKHEHETTDPFHDPDIITTTPSSVADSYVPDDGLFGSSCCKQMG
jgi:hypothetical protein